LSLKKYVIIEAGGTSSALEGGGVEERESTLTFDRVLLGFTYANVASAHVEVERNHAIKCKIGSLRIAESLVHTPFRRRGSGKKLEFVKCLSSLDAGPALDGLDGGRRHVPGPLCSVSATPRLIVHILAEPSSAVVKSSISGFLAMEDPTAAAGSRKTMDVTADAPWARAKCVLSTYL
jgi:hypothetical protein